MLSHTDQLTGETFAFWEEQSARTPVPPCLGATFPSGGSISGSVRDGLQRHQQELDWMLGEQQQLNPQSYLGEPLAQNQAPSGLCSWKTAPSPDSHYKPKLCPELVASGWAGWQRIEAEGARSCRALFEGAFHCPQAKSCKSSVSISQQWSCRQ